MAAGGGESNDESRVYVRGGARWRRDFVDTAVATVCYWVRRLGFRDVRDESGWTGRRRQFGFECRCTEFVDSHFATFAWRTLYARRDATRRRQRARKRVAGHELARSSSSEWQWQRANRFKWFGSHGEHRGTANQTGVQRGYKEWGGECRECQDGRVDGNRSKSSRVLSLMLAILAISYNSGRVSRYYAIPAIGI